MKSPVRNRIFLITGGVLLLLAVGMGRYLAEHQKVEETVPRHRAPHPVLIGEFTVPPLPKWHQRILTYEDIPNMTLEKREKEGMLQIIIGYFGNRKSDSPKNATELQSEVKRYLTDRANTLRIINTTAQFGASRPTKFNGMTAIETPVTTSNRVGGTMTGKYLHFIHNGRYYLMTSGIHIPVGKPSAPRLQTKLDQALVVISKSFSP